MFMKGRNTIGSIQSDCLNSWIQKIPSRVVLHCFFSLFLFLKSSAYFTVGRMDLSREVIEPMVQLLLAGGSVPNILSKPT